MGSNFKEPSPYIFLKEICFFLFESPPKHSSYSKLIEAACYKKKQSGLVTRSLSLKGSDQKWLSYEQIKIYKTRLYLLITQPFLVRFENPFKLKLLVTP